MSRVLSAAAVQSILSQDSQDDIAILLEISGAGIPNTIRLCDRYLERISEIPIRSISGNGAAVTVTTVDDHNFISTSTIQLVNCGNYSGTYEIAVTSTNSFTYPSSITGSVSLTKDSKAIDTSSDILVYGVRTTTVLTPKTRPAYQFVPMQITLPDQQVAGAPRARISINDITQEILPYLRELEGPANVTLKIALFSQLETDTSLTNIEASFSGLKLVSVTYNSSVISADLVMEGLEAEPFPAHNFAPINFPGLF